MIPWNDQETPSGPPPPHWRAVSEIPTVDDAIIDQLEVEESVVDSSSEVHAKAQGQMGPMPNRMKGPSFRFPIDSPRPGLTRVYKGAV